MKKTLTGYAVSAIALGAVLSVATAAPAKMGKGAKKNMAVTCPKCHMKLGTKKTKMATVPVKLNGTTYYCCAGCKAHPTGKKMPKSMGHMHKTS